jgi:glutaredoxin-like protein NrdH
MVKVFTKYGCPQCEMTKKVLDENGVEYELFNVEDNEEDLHYVKEVLGYSSMPVVEIRDGEDGFNEAFSGFRPDKLMSLSCK